MVIDQTEGDTCSPSSVVLAPGGPAVTLSRFSSHGSSPRARFGPSR